MDSSAIAAEWSEPKVVVYSGLAVGPAGPLHAVGLHADRGRGVVREVQGERGYRRALSRAPGADDTRSYARASVAGTREERDQSADDDRRKAHRLTRPRCDRR